MSTTTRSDRSRTSRALTGLTGLGIGVGLVLAPTAGASAAPTVAQPAATASVTASASVRSGPPVASTAGDAITRASITSRAQNWIDRKIPYSQSKYSTGPLGKKKYRQDCSGYVSMAWMATTSFTTLSISDVSHGIAYKSLKKGDAVWRRSGGEGHVVLFMGWTSSSHSTFHVWEERGTGDVALKTTYTVAYAKGAGFSAIRYDHIAS
jgi:hypothetical protein